ncbi:MAG: D-alanine--D-alanine ligase [Gemmatimonadetes bacterium]|nr:D-alanine--D-alanine ligase [Gemmatimonadota bacterium]
MSATRRERLPGRWVVLHGATGRPLPPDEQDTLDQAEAVAAALGRLGHEAVVLGASLDLGMVACALAKLRPEGVFNLVESLEGQARFAPLAPALVETLRIPFTGCSASALHATTDKLAAKQRMAAAGVPTPAWLPRHGGTEQTPLPAQRWILKPVDEDASVGLDADSVVHAADAAALGAALGQRTPVVGRELFAEEFVEGREIRIGLLGGPDGVGALPPSELVFVDFPAGRPRILDYRAKWEKTSFEYTHTRWSLEFALRDAPLLEELTGLARRCWDLFGLNGYARVEFRVDAERRPWVLEVNGNPCLAPDSGFIEAARHAGHGFDEVVRRICEAAVAFPPCRAAGKLRQGP